MSLLKSYKYRLYPTDAQKVLIEKHFGCARFIYNYGLDLKIKAYQNKKKLTCLNIMNKIPNLKKQEEFKWLSEVSAQSLQMSLRNLDNAFQRFFKEKKGFPKFKSKKDSRKSYHIPQDNKVNFDINKLFVNKMRKKGIKCVFDRKFEGTIKTVTISKTPTNKYFASILVETKDELKPKQEVRKDTTVGIDVGIKTFIVCSDGKTFENQKYLSKSLQRLKILQRRASNKQLGSNNRRKANLKVALLHEYITNQRNNYIHNAIHWLTAQENIQTICIEDLDVSQMIKNKYISRSLFDVSFARFFEILRYKAEWQGKNIITIGQFDASSKICSACGFYKSDLVLKDREWICPSCNTKHDRDLNAATNIKLFGLMRNSGQELPGELVESSALVETVKQETIDF